jgi:protein-L-isoaspartate O-methyltransferase
MPAMTSNDYVHGYSERERQRLHDQSQTLAELLHHDTIYPAGSHVPEADCGVGAQTVILAKNNPQTHFTSIDASPVSIEAAGAAVARAGFKNVSFRAADIFKLLFPEASFDHVLVCLVLEHRAAALRISTKPGGRYLRNPLGFNALAQETGFFAVLDGNPFGFEAAETKPRCARSCHPGWQDQICRPTPGPALRNPLSTNNLCHSPTPPRCGAPPSRLALMWLVCG